MTKREPGDRGRVTMSVQQVHNDARIHEARGAEKERKRIRRAQAQALKNLDAVFGRGILDSGAIQLLRAAMLVLDCATRERVRRWT